MNDRDCVWDCETYPNYFLLGAVFPQHPGVTISFEISDWKDDTAALIAWVNSCAVSDVRMIGFNSLGFDYPILHAIVKNGLRGAKNIYDLAKAIIESENKLPFMVRPGDRLLPQIDLFKIHHFDNKARTTSLKALEFNMGMDNIATLPIPVGTYLTKAQAEKVKDYCLNNDIPATRLFLEKSREQIKFREQMSDRYNKDFLNFSDVRTGKEIFQIKLEAADVALYTRGDNGREPRQTKRPSICLDECVPAIVEFRTSELRKVLDDFRGSVIRGTKGQFETHCTFGGLDYKFGTGGLHASQKNKIFESDTNTAIVDIDVKSLYPSIAIEYGYFPEHLGPKFVEIYRQIRDERFKYAKGTAENAALKLALNGVYGASSDIFSVFYDPLFTMKITVAGQLLISMLVERLWLSIAELEFIQVNTDGITLTVPRTFVYYVEEICRDWEKYTRLELEFVEYDQLFLADVNSYLAVDTKGNIKRKGRYEYDVEWHQNASALVVPKIAEQVLVNGMPIRETVENWPIPHDFMLRAKVPRSSMLVADVGFDYPLENLQRYYMATNGVKLVKIMPPLPKNPDKIRRFDINSGYKAWPCNNLNDAPMDNVDYDWYVNEIEKLLVRLR